MKLQKIKLTILLLYFLIAKFNILFCYKIEQNNINKNIIFENRGELLHSWKNIKISNINNFWKFVSKEKTQRFVRIKIIDKKIYSQDYNTNKMFINRKKRSIMLLQEMIDTFHTINNVDFILHISDQLSLDIINKVKFPFFVYAKNKMLDKKSILFPDFQLGSFAILNDVIEKIENKTNMIKWKNRRNIAFWRGGNNSPHRKKLVKIANKKDTIIDAKIGNKGQYVSMLDHVYYKYLISVDGCCSIAWLRNILIFYTKNVPIIQESPYIQWYRMIGTKKTKILFPLNEIYLIYQKKLYGYEPMIKKHKKLEIMHLFMENKFLIKNELLNIYMKY